VNEAGRRLGFVVESGLYRGRTGASGQDGIWRGASGHAIVVEVKTTTAYRIDLDTVAGYRTQLEESGAVLPGRGSILLVMGREETRGLEAQIRGSRYAWDMRMISVDALFDLVTIRERLIDPATQTKIHDILTPREYTRVDSIVELVFSTTQDVDLAVGDDEAASDSDEAGNERTPPAQFNAACIDRIERARGWHLLRQSRTTWTSADGSVGIVCVVSREHDAERRPNYWFSFHPYQQEALASVSESYLALGCATEDRVLLVPWETVRKVLPRMWQTHRDGRSYWHLVIDRRTDGFFARTRAGSDEVDWSTFMLE
jgi:hypothetical protein